MVSPGVHNLIATARQEAKYATPGLDLLSPSAKASLSNLSSGRNQGALSSSQRLNSKLTELGPALGANFQIGAGNQFTSATPSKASLVLS